MPGLFQDREDVAFRPVGTESDRGDAPLADAVIEIFKKSQVLPLHAIGKGSAKKRKGLLRSTRHGRPPRSPRLQTSAVRPSAPSKLSSRELRACALC